MALFSELRRRNVLKVALLYAVACWLVVWIVREAHDAFTLPGWTNAFTLTILALGFPAALWFAWTYEITPVGLRKASDVDQTQSIVYKTGQKLNAAVAVLLVLGVIAVFGQRLLPTFEFLVPGGPEGDAPANETTPAEIRSLTLENGLKVIVWPDPEADGALLYNFVHAARADGVCVGGHVTAYGARFTPEALEPVIEVEAERLKNVEPDLSVAMTEYGASFFEHRVYTDMRNRFPIYSRPSGLDACSERALIAYYQSFFAPNESTIVVVGNVRPDDVFSIVEDVAGSIPARDQTVFGSGPVDSYIGVRRTVVDPAVQSTMLQLSFHEPGDAGYKQLPMALLFYVLVGDEESRLQKSLIEDARLATRVEGHLVAATGPTVAHIELTLPSARNAAAAEEATFKALRQLVNEGIDDAALAAARKVVIEEYDHSLLSDANRAVAVGLYEIFSGDYEKLFKVPGELLNITAYDLQKIAAELFVESNLSVAVITPK
jgi:zinc protease